MNAVRTVCGRSGTILIVVSGIAAILAALALAFTITMRSDTEEANLLVSEAQSRIMLNAALMYVAETSRVGWQRADASEAIEAFGWVDVRSGKPGPRDQLGRLLYTGNDETGIGTEYPAVHTSVRCPFHLLNRPPCAVSPEMVANPMPLAPDQTWGELVSFKNPSPTPVVTDWDEFLLGDVRVRPHSQAMSWFRIYRRTPAIFTITCGSGATHGYRSYQEAADAGDGDIFNNDDKYFAEIRRQEFILWYEAEWSPGVASPAGYTTEWNDDAISPQVIGRPYEGNRTNIAPRNFAGTFLWIQRMSKEPAEW
jgi:hypothetical protein